MTHYLDEFTTVIVHVIVEDDSVVMTLVKEERVGVIAEVLEDRSKYLWRSSGNIYDASAGHKQKVAGAYVSCGGTEGRFIEGNCSYRRYEGSTEIRFIFDSETTNTDAFRVRDLMFFTSGLLVQEGSTASRILLRPVGGCKVCTGPLPTFYELESEVCNSCSDVCEHDYKEGVGRAGGRVVWLPFCQKCGRGDPEWQPSENPADDTIAVVANGGVDVLVLMNQDGSTTTIAKK